MRERQSSICARRLRGNFWEAELERGCGGWPAMVIIRTVSVREAMVMFAWMGWAGPRDGGSRVETKEVEEVMVVSFSLLAVLACELLVDTDGR